MWTACNADTFDQATCVTEFGAFMTNMVGVWHFSLEGWDCLMGLGGDDAEAEEVEEEVEEDPEAAQLFALLM